MDRTATLTQPESAPRPSASIPCKGFANAARALALLVAALLLPQLAACSWFEAPLKTTQFVGTWQSPRFKAPIRLYPNGEWEIQAPDGSVQQYGVWQLVDRNILWSSQSNGRVQHHADSVVSVSSHEFKVRERNGRTTTFVKLN